MITYKDRKKQIIDSKLGIYWGKRKYEKTVQKKSVAQY